MVSVVALAQQSFNVMTFNIRLNIASDSADAWPFRKDLVASQILFHKAHTVGVQEALYDQMTDLKARLPQYRSVGVGRADGKKEGEFSAIFFDTTRLQLLGSATFWLSENPDSIGKKGWDASLPRIVTWAKFKDRITKKIFFHFNTHYDHKGKVARRESSKLLMQKVKSIAGNTPVIITGDFNAEPAQEPIRLLVEAPADLRFTDAKKVSVMPHYGPTGTFNGFKSKEISNEPIDYIFIRNKVKVLQHASLSQTWGGRFSSDHFPVFAVIEIQ